MAGPEKAGAQGRIFRVSVLSGIFSQIFNSLCGPGSAFLTKYAIMLNASPLHFALISAIGQVSQIFQPLGALITGRRSGRKGVVLVLQFIGFSMALFYGILPFIFSYGNTINIFLVLLFISVSFLSVAGNAWIGWISDVVPLRLRARFFSSISQYVMITGVAASYIFSLFIDSFSKGSRLFSLSLFFSPENLPAGFVVIFLSAVAAGLIGLAVLYRLPEKAKKIEVITASGMFLLPLKDNNFRRFIIFNFWWMLAVGIGAPFWQPFMLQKLHMSLFEVQIYGSIHVASSILVLRLWGRLIDSCGNRTAMRLIILLGGFNPMIWLFVTPENYPVLYLEAITSGMMWAGAGVVSTNFVLSIAPDDKRQLYSGISGALAGIAMMTTMLASGVFLPQPFESGIAKLEPEQLLFGLTGIARWSAQIPLTLVHEQKSVPVIKAIESLIHKTKAKFLKYYTQRNK